VPARGTSRQRQARHGSMLRGIPRARDVTFTARCPTPGLGVPRHVGSVSPSSGSLPLPESYGGTLSLTCPPEPVLPTPNDGGQENSDTESRDGVDQARSLFPRGELRPADGFGGGSPPPRVPRPAIPRTVFPVGNRPNVGDSEAALKLPTARHLSGGNAPFDDLLAAIHPTSRIQRNAGRGYRPARRETFSHIYALHRQGPALVASDS
jgi:hypothetical protein